MWTCAAAPGVSLAFGRRNGRHYESMYLAPLTAQLFFGLGAIYARLLYSMLILDSTLFSL